MNFKNMDIWDVGLTKLAVLCATLFLVSIWSGFANWVINTHWAWFLVISLVAAIKPVMTVFKK
jgi:hypothetical protein